MEIIRTGMAGTMESSDINVVIEKQEAKGIKIYLNSSVEKQFGDQIRKVILETLEDLKVTNVVVRAVDRGALDCTIRARVQSAVMRAANKENELDWEVL
ncbi:citrate lyase acyl carrier protein [Paramaledivibacter caminithermalis]|jgi:citrate lyase subunit gamma (acyl carrier protein)|uniref:Citrate lyase acyl carrier protein n=1 Tax=Paramaledivibacter caminithermalis (strain DSM 15212 / CIP 107654 / DViRD3) TaxID=1121301 RepID=A0A1M6PCE5_PARC5|nr:citrate lyase acyl carrier protein [Paramaledivibacter caminithermalis]SHK05631.1 citrate lyase subunit gamma (acyl carrier protein) [Paramaledivibacter caminithermalis DSM 15212]